MAIVKIICALALLAQTQFNTTSCSDPSPSRGVSRSEGLKQLFGKDFQSDFQSLSIAFTSGSEPRPFANDKAATGSDENDEIHITGPSIDLLETDKHGLRVGYLGGEEESSFTESGRKTDQQDEKMRITQESHAIVSPRVRKIMLLKARAIANATKEDISKEVLNHDENEDDHKPHDSITKTTLHNILSQTEENENKLDNKKMQKRALNDQSYADVASGSAITSETDAEINGRSKDQNADSSSELDGVRRESEAETKGEPVFTGKNIGSFEEKGSGDVQLSGSGMMLSQNLREQVTTPGADGRKVVSGHRGPKRESTLIKHVRLRDHANPPKGIVNGEGKSGSEKMPFDPILLFQVRNIRTNVLKAEKQATVELNDVRKEFRAKMEDVEEDLRMVKKLTSNVHKKVGITVQQALAMARQAKTNATNRLFMARRAATALNSIEKKLGVIHTINASRILRSKIPQFPNLSDVAIYKQLLETNAILAKLDGAKVLAIDRAEKRFRNEEETGSSINQEVDSLRDELASAEEELSEETDREMEDEREAQEKIQEAMERNKLVAKKTAFALTAIENYLEKLQSDESKLKRLRF